MSRPVLDASALLALLLDEPGAEEVMARAEHAFMVSINLAEVVSVYAKRGSSLTAIKEMIAPLAIEIVLADIDLSFDAGMLRPLTLKGGLSLGDRYCLALGKRLNRPILTAERRWPDIAEAAGVTLELIR